MPDPRPSAGDCPSAEQLARFGTGELDDPTFETVAGHLTRCGACLGRVAELYARSADDPLDRLVRECLVTPDVPATAEYAGPDVTATHPGGGPPAGPDPWVGARVGRYHLLKRLGRGGMGVVYLAEDPVIGRAVALKMISADGVVRARGVDRFRTEGRALARVRHPNVVQFFHFDEQAGHPYFTMEFVDGPSLAARLPHDPLPARDAAALVRTLAGAIHAVHGQGVIHRDIKPSNVLIGRDGTPRVADFGLAKLADAAGRRDDTHTGMVLGTPAYMAPEQAEGRVRDIDARTDVYALGAVLVAAVTGRPPPAAGRTPGGPPVCPALVETGPLVSSGTPDGPPPDPAAPARLAEVLRTVPGALARICEKCLEQSPGRRYATAQALADDLGDWLDGRPPRGLPGPLARALRPTRRRVLAVGLGLAAAGAGVVAYRRNPAVILSGIQSDLRAGKAVTLIGDAGPPRWSRWVAGAGKGQLGEAADGAFSVRAGDDLALVELLPDPQVEAYQLAVQVRHDAAEVREASEVGVYVTRRGHRLGAADDAQFFLQFSANDILTAAARRVFIDNGQPFPIPEGAQAALRPRLYGKREGRTVNLDMGGASSPPFTPAGEDAGVWRTVVMTVTPLGVECWWDGVSASLPAGVINREAAWSVGASVEPVLRQLAPEYSHRGGLGLSVAWGTASFRSATLTPSV